MKVTQMGLFLFVVMTAACGGPTANPSSATGTAASAATVAPTRTPNPPPTPPPTPRFDDQALAVAVNGSPFGITDVVIYTAETDKNKLLGRPGQYVGKVSWNDPRVASRSYEATIELFADKASMDARFTYIDAIIKSSPLLLQYMYRNDGRLAILRVPKDLTPTQAQAYADWFAKL